MSKKRAVRVAILSVIPTGLSGWARYTRELITALAKCDAEIVLITSTDAPPTVDGLDGLPVIATHRLLPPLIPVARQSSLRLLASVPAVRRATASCDVVHAAVEPYTLAALATPTGQGLFVTAHGTYVVRTAGHPLFGVLYRFLYRRSAILCVSSYTQSRIRAVFPDLHTVVIPNGVNVQRYRQTSPAALPEAHVPTILSVGQVKARKGFHLLAQAMRQVRAVIPGAQAVFIGDLLDTAYIDGIKAQLAADGMEDAVQFLGRVPDDELLDWYRAADVFALPALNTTEDFEGFGLVYLEASAAGLPVIGTHDCGAEDAIRDGETGFLIPQNDPDALADRLIRLLGDAKLRARMGAAGAAFAGEHGWDHMARQMLEVYRDYPAEVSS